MAEYGILVDYEWCTACHTCETACQMEHGLPVGQFGIKLQEIGPWQTDEGKWVLVNIPVPTAQCDVCAERQGQGKLPACVHHCQAQCLKVGPIEELATEVASKKELALFHI